MRQRRIVLPLVLVLLATVACNKKPITAPVPGSVDSLDAYAYRIVSDSQAAILSMKTWETCSDQKFPATVTFDGQTVACDAASGTFPTSARQPLYRAELAYNVAQAAGKAYHSGASKDAAGLTTALTQLSQSIGVMLQAGGKQ